MANYFALAIVLVSSVVIDGQAPSFAPSARPTFAPSIMATPLPTGPTLSPTQQPTSAFQLDITQGALAAAVIFSIVAGVFILLFFIYIFRARKGSSPAQYYFPSYYAYYYPKRQHFLKSKPEIELMEVDKVEDVKKDANSDFKRDKLELIKLRDQKDLMATNVV